MCASATTVLKVGLVAHAMVLSTKAIILRCVPVRGCLHCARVQYGIITLLDYILEQLADRLYNKFTLNAPYTTNATCVFKSLVAAEQLQLSQLRDACVKALGTYLLPDFHKQAAACKDALKSLSSDTLSDVVIAIARSDSCSSRVALPSPYPPSYSALMASRMASR